VHVEYSEKQKSYSHIPQSDLENTSTSCKKITSSLAATSMLTLTPTNFRKTPNNLHKRHDLSNSSVNVNLFQNRKI